MLCWVVKFRWAIFQNRFHLTITHAHSHPDFSWCFSSPLFPSFFTSWRSRFVTGQTSNPSPPCVCWSALSNQRIRVFHWNDRKPSLWRSSCQEQVQWCTLRHGSNSCQEQVLRCSLRHRANRKRSLWVKICICRVWRGLRCEDWVSCKDEHCNARHVKGQGAQGTWCAVLAVRLRSPLLNVLSTTSVNCFNYLPLAYGSLSNALFDPWLLNYRAFRFISTKNSR